MTLRLIDSRNRVATGKRYVWEWPDDDIEGPRKAWTLVLHAEVEPSEYESYLGFVNPLNDDHATVAEVFADYWNEYGWDLYYYDPGDMGRDDPADMVLMDPATPAAKTL